MPCTANAHARDIFCLGWDIEKVAGTNLRLICYVGDGDERVEVARLILPVTFVPEAVIGMIGSVGGADPRLLLLANGLPN